MQSAMKGKVQPIMLWEGKVPWKAKMPCEAKVPWTENAMNELSDLKGKLPHRAKFLKGKLA